MIEALDQFLAAGREYPQGVAGWILAGVALSWTTRRLDARWERRRQEREDRKEQRLEEEYRTRYRPELAERMARERGCEPSVILAQFERHDHELAAAKEAMEDDAAIARAAAERRCDPATLLGRVAARAPEAPAAAALCPEAGRRHG